MSTNSVKSKVKSLIDQTTYDQFFAISYIYKKLN